jgi:hypothetical protein
MAGSPADAISKAVERSKQLLFQPLKAEKWFALGFIVFLAQCGEGGGGGQFPNLPSGSTPSPPRGGGGPSGPAADFQKMIDEAVRAFTADVALYVTIGVAVFAFGLGLWLFIAWFSSRAKLMFVESVVWDRVELGPQWARAAELGFSLFKFRVLVTTIAWVVFLGAVVGAVLLALADWQSGNFFGPQALAAYAVFGAVFLFFGLPLGIMLAILEDFVVPLMVVRNLKVSEAWAACRAEVLSGNFGGMFVFYVLRFLLGIGIAIAVMILTCLTCCMTAIPYIGTVLLLPVWVFSRSFPLYYMEQLGIQVFPAPDPDWAAYDQWRFPR